MKVGIVTYNEAINYGAHLQAYALQSFINSTDHQAYQVRIQNDDHKIFVALNNFHSVLANLRRVVFYPRFRKKINKFVEFEKKYIQYTNWVANENTIENYENEFDAWITGSDQVWRCKYGMNPVFFLEFVKSRKKIAYAASMGEPQVKEDEYGRFTNALSSFNYISVREDSIQPYISDVSKLDVCCVLDPVFLLSKEQWEKFIYKINQKYIFVYATQVSDELLNQIKKLQSQTGYKVYSIHKLPGVKAKILEYCSGPSDFLSYIANAQYVITSSFHCTAFSIIFEKNFITVSHSSTGARTNDLLKKFGIDNESAKIDMYQFFNELGYDYGKINKKKDSYVQSSVEFLSHALSD